MIKTLKRSGYHLNRLGSDQAIVPGSAPEKLQEPLYDMGIDVCCAYGQRDRGLQGGYRGLIWVDGHPYCESMPKGLINAPDDYNIGKITENQMLAKIEERGYYLAKPNGAPDKNGAIQYLHPVDNGRHVCNPQRDDAPKFCRQRSIVVPRKHLNLKFRQQFRYMTAEWFREHYTARSANEGFNGYISDNNKEALETTAKRRVRGYGPQYISVAMKVASANFRKIQTFVALSEAEKQAMELKRIKRRRGTSHERFYESKHWIGKIRELNEATGQVLLVE